jgi:hypothetical protein
VEVIPYAWTPSAIGFWGPLLIGLLALALVPWRDVLGVRGLRMARAVGCAGALAALVILVRDPGWLCALFLICG